jgi:hypothetical protein
MLTHAWRGLPRLRGVPDSPNAAERKGLVEHVYEVAVNYTPVNPHPPGLFRPPAR